MSFSCGAELIFANLKKYALARIKDPFKRLIHQIPDMCQDNFFVSGAFFTGFFFALIFQKEKYTDCTEKNLLLTISYEYIGGNFITGGCH